MAIHQLDRVNPVVNAPGKMRIATDADVPLLIQWVQDFSREIHEPVHEDPKAHVARRLAQNQMFLLCVDDVPVSLTAVAGPTPNGIRINSVFTPREYRKHGYATALVAGVSRRMLDSGKKFCFLYTDLANPTSNKIYAGIGYRRIADQLQISFSP